MLGRLPDDAPDRVVVRHAVRTVPRRRLFTAFLACSTMRCRFRSVEDAGRPGGNPRNETDAVGSALPHFSAP